MSCGSDLGYPTSEGKAGLDPTLDDCGGMGIAVAQPEGRLHHTPLAAVWGQHHDTQALGGDGRHMNDGIKEGTSMPKKGPEGNYGDVSLRQSGHAQEVRIII